MHTKYTKEVLAPIVASSISMAGVLRALGLRPSGSSQGYITKIVKSLGLDVSHFLGRRVNSGLRYRGGSKPISPSKILILRTEEDSRIGGQRLRRALLEIGYADVCNRCGQQAEWRGYSLLLIPDHKNGKAWDNRPENLELLCPNCHSQTETFAGRNNRKS
jgi:HNH endonuclease